MRNFAVLWLALLPASVLLAQPVREETMLDVGGTEVYLEISGQRADAPVLLYLHGGPGNVVAGVLLFREHVGRQLEEDFLVVYLHQRGAGKSPPVQASEQTIAAHIGDVEQVVSFLKAKYRTDRLSLLGHSWGAILAALYADVHREDVDKLVLMSATVNVRSQFRDSRLVTLEWARENDMTEAVSELSVVDTSFETARDAEIVGRWASQARGGFARNLDMGLTESLWIDLEYPHWRERTAEIGEAMIDETLEIDLDEAITSFDIPALFIAGALDTIVAERSMRRDFARYGGKKSLVVLDESHHLPFIDQPDELALAVRTFLLD
jgi:proline iminopeptidase